MTYPIVMKPHTAGKILTSQDLRTYSYCSEQYHLLGASKPSPFDQICKHALELLLSGTLRTENKKGYGDLDKVAMKSIKRLDFKNYYEDGQVDAWYRQCVLWLNEFQTLFHPSKYIVVTGSIPWKVKISKTLVDFEISGILRTRKNQTLHAIIFNPNSSAFDKLNDPSIPALLETVGSFVEPRPSGKKQKGMRAQAQLHILGTQKSLPYLNYASVDSNEIDIDVTKNRLKGIVHAMEVGIHYPTIPCRNLSCNARQKCIASKK